MDSVGDFRPFHWRLWASDSESVCTDVDVCTTAVGRQAYKPHCDPARHAPATIGNVSIVSRGFFRVIGAIHNKYLLVAYTHTAEATTFPSHCASSTRNDVMVHMRVLIEAMTRMTMTIMTHNNHLYRLHRFNQYSRTMMTTSTTMCVLKDLWRRWTNLVFERI